jgi:WD40 repeat protein
MLVGHSDWVASVAFSHNSTRLASGSHDYTVKIWDPSSGACLQKLVGHSSYVYSVAFSHDSTRLASGSHDYTVKIWDPSSGACLQTLVGHSSYVDSVAFSHDSTRLASGSHDYTVKIWDVSCGACLQTCKGHSDLIVLVAFLHQSARLASLSYDDTVKIWDASSGVCLQTIHTGQVPMVKFLPKSALYDAIRTFTLQSAEDLSTREIVECERPLDVATSPSISTDGTWIRHDGRNILWIPSEYRPSCSAEGRTTVGIGVMSGRVWFCSIDLQYFQQ